MFAAPVATLDMVSDVEGITCQEQHKPERMRISRCMHFFELYQITRRLQSKQQEGLFLRVFCGSSLADGTKKQIYLTEPTWWMVVWFQIYPKPRNRNQLGGSSVPKSGWWFQIDVQTWTIDSTGSEGRTR